MGNEEKNGGLAHFRLAKCAQKVQTVSPQRARRIPNLRIMRKYEALIVLNMKGAETLDELTAAISEKLKEAGANVTEVTNVGRREFAYESNHMKSGQYMLFAFEAEPQTIRAAREALAIDERVHYQYYRVK